MFFMNHGAATAFRLNWFRYLYVQSFCHFRGEDSIIFGLEFTEIFYEFASNASADSSLNALTW